MVRLSPAIKQDAHTHISSTSRKAERHGALFVNARIPADMPISASTKNRRATFSLRVHLVRLAVFLFAAAPVLFWRARPSSKVLSPVASTHLVHRSSDGHSQHPHSACKLPKMLIVVLTANRPDSLLRLLDSLERAHYGCSGVDLQVNVDAPKDLHAAAAALSLSCVKVANDYSWSHGRKVVFQRIAHAGLSQSWFEIPWSSAYEYLAIFEDDMQINEHFYDFLTLLHSNGVLHSNEVTAICLHPNDWEVKVQSTCEYRNLSKHFYLSPEPCNWGPIWKYKEWQKYVAWVVKLKLSGEMPYVPEEIAYNFNKYLRDNKDVQSSWVWRYNFDFGKHQLRYSFTKCFQGRSHEIYFAINHKEPGEHFKKKLNLQNDPKLVHFDYSLAVRELSKQFNSFSVRPFPGYEKGAKSMRGRLL
mmetsp:Transcript_12692/g.53700  ORF Transcript_12692/g.53700 Transcript_12692/m.53700 type:complete len:416 (-) Transcript_12692:661-1908(-)